MLAESCSRFGAVTWKLELTGNVTLKSAAFTVMDSMAAVEPETFSVTPLTLRTVSVVSDTSLYAANASAGANSAAKIPAPVSIRGIVSVV